MVTLAQMHTAPLSSPRPVPVGEKCGAASRALPWLGLHRQAMPRSAVSADLTPKPVTPGCDPRLQVATEVRSTMRLIHLVVCANVKQHNDFATTGGIPFNRKHNPAIVSTATGAQAFKRPAQLVRTL